MRFNINLASQPYEDARRFYMQWIPLVSVLAILAVAMSWLAYSNYVDYGKQNKELNEVRQKIAEAEKKKTIDTETLNRPENSGTRDQSQFLNSLFARKAFSWTQVLSDLEKIMPTQVQVTAIKPEVNPAGQLLFTLSVVTTKRDEGIELVRRMESSPRFIAAQVKNESTKVEAKTNRVEYQLEIAALYRPNLAKASK